MRKMCKKVTEGEEYILHRRNSVCKEVMRLVGLVRLEPKGPEDLECHTKDVRPYCDGDSFKSLEHVAAV